MNWPFVIIVARTAVSLWIGQSLSKYVTKSVTV